MGGATAKSREDGEKRVIRTKGIRRAINHPATYSLQGRSPLRDTNIITTVSSFSSLLRFFSREKEKDIHVLERVTRAGPRGRIQREAGKKNGIDIIIIGCRYYNFPFRTS